MADKPDHSPFVRGMGVGALSIALISFIAPDVFSIVKDSKKEMLKNAKPVTEKVAEMRNNRLVERVDTVAWQIPHKPEFKKYLPE